MAAIFALLQRVLPKYALTAIAYRLARIRHSGIKNFLIRRFIRLYDVDVSDVAADIPGAFEDFNAFFVRALRAEARPIDNSDSAIVSPVDGTVSQAGPINENLLFQAKGFRYSLEDLLAADLQDAESYVDGRFATLYLAPYNYHRVHAPLTGRIRLLRYVPGDLYSVNRATVTNVDGLFTRNERLICHVERDGGPYVLVFVGALNVGSISTPWTGEIRPRASGTIEDYRPAASGSPATVDKGDMLGWFNMGSTVIVLMPRGSADWVKSLTAGSAVRMGERIGALRDPQ